MEKVPIIIVQLLHIQGPLKGEIQEFTEKVLLIGRHHSCHVCFPKNLSIVSQHHALIVREGNQFKLIDQGSVNGTFLNGTLVHEAYLKNGDVLTFAIGGPKVSFLTKIEESSKQVETNALPSQALPERSSEKEQKPPLVIQFGPTLNSARELPVTIGKQKLEQSDVIISHPNVEDQHLRIFHHKNEYWVQDLTGKGLVLIDGAPVKDGVPLGDEDILSLSPHGPNFRYLGGGRLVEIEEPLDFNDHATEETLMPKTPVQFSVYHFQELSPGRWYTLLSYIHLPNLREIIDADCKRRIPSKELLRQQTGDANQLIARETEIRIVPELLGCRFNPPFQNVIWVEDWHRAEFRMQALTNLPGFALNQPVTGRVAFYVQTVLVGEVPIWAVLSERNGAVATGRPPRSRTTDPYQAIFTSYSHQDYNIVERIGRAYKALGMQFLRDVEILRSGEEWNPTLLQYIEKADIFQLYWSNSARKSVCVRNEWKHALNLAKKNFIRPVYWQDPMPKPPPELRKFHFAYYQFD